MCALMILALARIQRAGETLLKLEFTLKFQANPSPQGYFFLCHHSRGTKSTVLSAASVVPNGGVPVFALGWSCKPRHSSSVPLCHALTGPLRKGPPPCSCCSSFRASWSKTWRPCHTLSSFMSSSVACFSDAIKVNPPLSRIAVTSLGSPIHQNE